MERSCGPVRLLVTNRPGIRQSGLGCGRRLPLLVSKGWRRCALEHSTQSTARQARAGSTGCTRTRHRAVGQLGGMGTKPRCTRRNQSWRPLRDSLQLHIIAESVHLVICLAALQELGVPVAKVREALLNHPRLSAIADRSSQVNDLSGEPQV